MMSQMVQPVYIVAAKRTPVGKAKGVFAKTRPDDLLSETLRALMRDVKNVPLEVIDDVIIGCAMPEAEQGMNVARIACLLADFPVTVPALTVNRFCSSGLQTIQMAANNIALGQADVVIAGGVESMSFVPLGGYHYAANPRYFDGQANHQSIAYSMGMTAEKVAKKWNISREEQDQFALRSHQKALNAIQEGAFSQEIVAIKTKDAQADLMQHQIVCREKIIEHDQGPRRDTTLEGLSRLKPVFALNGSVTAGNTSQMSDGAAALLLVSEKAMKQYQLTPLARWIGFAVAGVEPEWMGIGPVRAIPKLLERSGVGLEQIDWIELNEAFAAQSLAVIKELDIPMDKVNPLGGAIALGHPLGATGAILATKMLYGAKSKSYRYGMVTMCIGTGMGAAGLFEIL